jgi:HD-GYP domain-containing protein (c-di-GMP phosphodiesterase class II)
MMIHAWSKDTMAQCSSVDTPIHFPISEAGVWGDCVRQRKLVMINDYEAPWPDKKGYPEGHVPIRRFLSVPIFDGNKIVTVAAVANKKEPYVEEDVAALISLANKMWEILRRKRAEEELRQTLDSLRKAFGTTIQVMVSAVEARDPYTSGHQIRSADLARAIATQMGLPHEKIDGIRMAGSIHDIGKLSIPAEILSKPTKLSEIEFSLIKEHSQKGYEMLKDVESPWPLAEIVFQHHERLNGSGYPRNLKGDEIIIEARIMAVADVVEAMASHRPYRPALGLNAALEEIEKNRGTLYDAGVADACLILFRKKGFQLDSA